MWPAEVWVASSDPVAGEPLHMKDGLTTPDNPKSVARWDSAADRLGQQDGSALKQL
jgi:hypothetical protein